MLCQATVKISGKKSLKVKVAADLTINAIRINGDYFLYPEETIFEIEKSLIGQTVKAPLADQIEADSMAARYASLIHKVLVREKAAFIGVTPEDIANAIVTALKKNNTRPPSPSQAAAAKPCPDLK